MALAATLLLRSAEAASAYRVHVRGTAAATIQAAIEGAARRLGRPECARILADFSDASGHSLEANAAALGQDAAGYLGLIVFGDGVGDARCAHAGVLAITEPGSRVVHFCPQFARKQQREPAVAETVVIHEALHSLGLGENPPSSAEITARVFDRCGH